MPTRAQRLTLSFILPWKRAQGQDQGEETSEESTAVKQPRGGGWGCGKGTTMGGNWGPSCCSGTSALPFPQAPGTWPGLPSHQPNFRDSQFPPPPSSVSPKDSSFQCFHFAKEDTWERAVSLGSHSPGLCPGAPRLQERVSGSTGEPAPLYHHEGE